MRRDEEVPIDPTWQKDPHCRTQGEIVGLGIRSEEIKGVSHDSVWRSMMLSIREPARCCP